MSLKSYNSKTLVGNWFEDEANRSAGVTPSTGNEFRSTAKEDFRNPASRQEFRLAGKGARPRMLSVENYTESEAPRVTISAKTGFRVLSEPPTEEEEAATTTTAEEAFGPRQRRSELEQYRTRTGRVKPAGGLPGARGHKEVRPSGASGEVFRTGSEPTDNTAVQRAWLYSSDPLFQAMDHPRGVIEVPELSLPIKDSTEPPEPRPFKQLLTRKHANKDTGVWMDWNPKKGSV